MFLLTHHIGHCSFLEKKMYYRGKAVITKTRSTYDIGFKQLAKNVYFLDQVFMYFYNKFNRACEIPNIFYRYKPSYTAVQGFSLDAIIFSSLFEFMYSQASRF